MRFFKIACLFTGVVLSWQGWSESISADFLEVEGRDPASSYRTRVRRCWATLRIDGSSAGLRCRMGLRERFRLVCWNCVWREDHWRPVWLDQAFDVSESSSDCDEARCFCRGVRLDERCVGVMAAVTESGSDVLALSVAYLESTSGGALASLVRRGRAFGADGLAGRRRGAELGLVAQLTVVTGSDESDFELGGTRLRMAAMLASSS